MCQRMPLGSQELQTVRYSVLVLPDVLVGPLSSLSLPYLEPELFNRLLPALEELWVVPRQLLQFSDSLLLFG